MNRISVFAQNIYGKVKPKTPTTAGFNFTGFARLQDDQNAPPAVPLVNQIFPKPLTLRKNQTEEKRLQGLMLKNKEGSVNTSNSKEEENSKASAIKKWYINEGDRRSFFAVWIILHCLVWGLGYTHYQLKDNQVGARATFGFTYPVARASALVLHLDVALLLFPICRNFITLIRRTYLNNIIPFDANITFHKATGFSLAFFSLIHTIAHMRNFALFGSSTKTAFKGFLLANFATGPGVTGWIMSIILGIMVWFAMEKRKKKNFERFWYTHHLYFPFFFCWQLHGMFCMIKPDAFSPQTQLCDYWQIGVFWKYIVFSGVVFVYERILREIRSRHKTYISKVIQHPGGVVEVQIKKEKTVTRADFISVNIKMVGDWTKAFGGALGCVQDKKWKEGEKTRSGMSKKDNELLDDAPLKRVLPRIMVDGPFGSASEDFEKFEVVMLCAAGIGVTPFASILKSIWYRINYPKENKKTRVQKVYFFWICRDTESVSWFRSLLAAIEAQDTHNRIEIMTYVTQKMKDDELTNIMVSDVGGEADTISGLRASTHYGRPNWDQIFSGIRDRHPDTEVGTLFCGPKALGSTLHQQCNKWSSGDEHGTKFIWGKENF